MLSLLPSLNFSFKSFRIFPKLDLHLRHQRKKILTVKPISTNQKPSPKQDLASLVPFGKKNNQTHALLDHFHIHIHIHHNPSLRNHSLSPQPSTFVLFSHTTPTLLLSHTTSTSTPNSSSDCNSTFSNFSSSSASQNDRMRTMREEP